MRVHQSNHGWNMLSRGKSFINHTSLKLPSAIYQFYVLPIPIRTVCLPDFFHVQNSQRHIEKCLLRCLSSWKKLKASKIKKGEILLNKESSRVCYYINTCNYTMTSLWADESLVFLCNLLYNEGVWELCIFL